MIDGIYRSAQRTAYTAATLLLISTMAIAAKPTCFNDAIEKAPKLIEYHFGDLNGFIVEIDRDSVKNLKPIKSSADGSESLTVVEVWGTIYKGNYRTRFIFSTKAGDCLLVGQEVLEVDHF